MCDRTSHPTHDGSAGISLRAALILSLLLHSAGGVTMGVLMGRGGSSDDRSSSDRSADDGSSPPEIRLGEERGSPVSLSWVVLPEPSPHASAEPSEVVQPELRLEAVTPPPGVPDPAAEPVVVTDARIRAEAMAAMRALAQTRTRTVRRVLDGARSLIMTHAPMLEVLGRLRADAPETQVAERPAPEQQQQAGPVADEGQRGPESAPEAVESDREADAISTIEALVDLLGSDIA